MARLVDGVRDDQLDDPTPCTDTPVRDLLNHLLGLTVAFRDARRKGGRAHDVYSAGQGQRPTPGGLAGEPAQPARPGGAGVERPAGMTMAGGVRFPAEVAGPVTLNEVQMHGWDLARATGQPYEVDDESAEAVLPIVAPTGDDFARAGMFGPPVDVPEDAPLFDRVLGFGGRDPSWAPT